MDVYSVYSKNLTEILTDLKDQRISIKLQNKSGSWSAQFYTIEDVKELDHKQFKLTVLLLYNPVESDSTVVDIKSITGITLQKPHGFNGIAYDGIKVIR